MNKQLEDIKLIREMMERSSKFVSLSGLAGILAGLIALCGMGVAYYIFANPGSIDLFNIGNINPYYQIRAYNSTDVLNLYLIGLIVLILSLTIGIWFSYRKAVKLNQRLINKTSLRVLYNGSIPLVTGGIVTLLLASYLPVVLAMTLIFYGLALVNVSKFTYDEVHYLGLTEILIGLISLAITMWIDADIKVALICWGTGFGVCHIIYGTAMYIKYDLKK